MGLFTRKNKRRINYARQDESITGNFRRNSVIRHKIVDSPSSSRLQAHQLVNKRRKIMFILTFMVLLMILLLLLVINFTARPITSFSIGLKDNPEASYYELTIQDYLNDNPLSRFNFIIKIKDLENHLVYRSPEVEAVKLLGMASLGRTEFLIKMRKPVASWSINNKKYYVDEKGITFDKNYYSEPDLSIFDDSGAPVEAGSTMISRRLLGFVGLAVSWADKNGYNVVEAILPEGTMRQVDIKLANITPYIKLSVDRPVGEQIEDMDRALKYFNNNNIHPTYIDVRVSNKVFYK